MRRPPFYTALSAVALALVAAAIGDPLVESISNTGVFGRGYLDRDQSSVIPFLAAGLLLCAIFLAVRVREAILRDVASALANDPSPRMLAFICGAHFAIVYAMECSEAALSGGAPIDGFSWLGAPVAFALLAHVAICLTCVLAARHAVRALVIRVVAAVFYVCDLLLAARSRNALVPIIRRSSESLVRTYDLVVVEGLRGRAPPLRTAFVIPR